MLCTAAICSDNRWLSADDVSGGNTYKERERCRRTRRGERTGGRWKGKDDETAQGGREGLKRTAGDEKELEGQSDEPAFPGSRLLED